MTRTSTVYRKENYTHLLFKGTMTTPLFKTTQDYNKFIDILVLKQHQFMFQIIAYTLFPDHIHLIIEESCKGTLSSVIHGLSLLYTKYYQKKYDITGPIFSGSYRRDLITNNKDLLCRIRYIHQKPKRKQLSTNLNYKYSSFYSYCHPEESSIINRHIVYQLFDKHDDIKASNLFKSIHHEFSTSDILDIDDHIYEKVSIAKQILKDELTNYHLHYEHIPKHHTFRESLILKIHQEANLSQQEIADLLNISRHIVGRTIRLNKPT